MSRNLEDAVAAGLSRSIATALRDAGLKSVQDTDEMSDLELLEIKGIGMRGALELRTFRLRGLRMARDLRQDYMRPGTVLSGDTGVYHPLRGQVPRNQLVDLAEAEGCEIVQKVDSVTVPLNFRDATGDEHLAAQLRTAEAVERVEQILSNMQRRTTTIA